MGSEEVFGTYSLNQCRAISSPTYRFRKKAGMS